MANSAKLYKAMLDGLEYRGTAFFQGYTTCQPEHGVADDMCADQAKLVRDARGMPEFVFNPQLRRDRAGVPSTSRAIPALDRDWWRPNTVHRRGIQLHRRPLGDHRGRFRKHLKAITRGGSRRS